MRKGTEILTIKELHAAKETCRVYVNDVLFSDVYYDMNFKRGDKLFHALPDYEPLTQRVFDGVDSDINIAVVNVNGTLFHGVSDNVIIYTIKNKETGWQIKDSGSWKMESTPEINYKPMTKITRDRTSDGYTLDEAIELAKNNKLEFALYSRWVKSGTHHSILKDCDLSDYRKRPELSTFQNTPIGGTYIDEDSGVELRVVEYTKCKECYYYEKGKCFEAHCMENHCSYKSVMAVRVKPIYALTGKIVNMAG